MELTNLMEKTSERYKKMQENMGKKDKFSHPEKYDSSNLDAQIRNMKAEGFSVEEGPPPA